MRRCLPALLLLAACSGTKQFSGECENNSQCPVGAICRMNASGGAGLCVCRSDEACGPGEICNSQGICQKRAGCRSNVECESSKFCDLGTGTCIDRTACGSDVHCLPGSVCESGRCVDGCHVTADCPLYTVCEGGSATAIGQCIAGKCDDKSFCDFGSSCTNDTCAADNNPNLCKLNCGQNNRCGPGDFCLVNSSYDPNNPRSNYQTFCGVQCENENDCPNGYNCGGVVLLTQDQCTNDNECGGGGRRCFLGEGDLRGFCSCVDDEDCATRYAAPPSCSWGSCGGLGIVFCPDDTPCISSCDFGQRYCEWPQGRACNSDTQCDPLPLCGPFLGPGTPNVCITNQGMQCTSDEQCLCVNGTCANTGRPCTSGAQCNPPCLRGGCFLGSACAPEEGLLCTDVR